MHTRVSGVADYPAASEDEAIAIARDIVAQWHRPRRPVRSSGANRKRRSTTPSELYGVMPRDIKVQFDMREVIARLVDGSRFHEYQPAYGTTLVCGFAHLWGYKIGILANNGVLFNDSTLKGAHFIELCNQNRTPMLFLQNITGYMVGREYERRRHHQGRRQDDHGGVRLRGAQVHRDRQRLVRRRQLRHVGPRVRSAFPVHVAAEPDLGDGRRTGGQRAVRRQAATAAATRDKP